MIGFKACAFDAETDVDRPVIGTVVCNNGQFYRIEKVHWCTTQELMRDKYHVNEAVMDNQGYDVCLERQHSLRPHVHWLVWCSKVEAQK